MTTFNAFADPSSLPALPKLPALPVLGAVRKGVTLDDPFSEPEESAPEQPAAPVRKPAGEELDTFIAANRARTPAAETTARRVQRSSIAELNQTDMDEIRSRFLTIHRDTRSPVATVLDLLDAPRNVVMSTLAPKLREKAEAEGNTGTGGVGRVNFSDVLTELGVTNRVAAGLLGFVGDVAFDPLTYVGPAGWGAQLSTKAGQGVAKVGLRAAGSKALKREIAAVAAGSARVGDDAARAYLAAKGFTPEALAARAAGGATPKQLQSEMAQAVFGNPKRSILETTLRPLGGERTVEGGNLAADFFRSDAVDPASAAAKAFIAKYGEGTGKALRLGKAKGSVGTQIAHIPFLSYYTVQMGRWTGGAKVNARNLAIAKSTAIGASDAVNGIVDPYLDASRAINGVSDEVTETLDTLASERAMSEELRKNLPDDLPPPPETGGDYTPPPDGPTPIVPGGLEIPEGSPVGTSKYIVNTDDFPAAKPDPGFDVDARAQELLESGEAGEMDEALEMARMEARAAERGAAVTQPAQSPSPAEVSSPVAKPTYASSRERVLSELDQSQFAKSVAPEQREAWSAIMDARARQWAREGPGRTADDFWAQLRIENGPDGKSALNQSENSPIWYSKLSQAVNEKMGGSMDAAQLKAMLQNNGVKPEELEWSKIGDLSGKVTKQDVLDHLAENAVQVTEKVLGELPTGWKVIESTDGSGQWWDVVDQNGKMWARNRDRDAAISAAKPHTPSGDTKFAQYVEPGGTDYRELLLTLPESKGPVLPGESQNSNLLAEGRRLRGSYMSSHFDEPNILAHIRFNTRTDAQGKKVLFIEEIQSDWHQKGREKGYAPSPADKAIELQDLDRTRMRLRDIETRTAYIDNDIVTQIREMSNQVGDPNAGKALAAKNLVAQMREVNAAPVGKMSVVLEQQSERLRSLWGAKAAELDRLAKEELDARNAIFAMERKHADAVPDAPFKKTWHELAMKRAIRYASENGYDRVAWTTGAQQAERYDLSKQVNSIQWEASSIDDGWKRVEIFLKDPPNGGRGGMAAFGVKPDGTVQSARYGSGLSGSDGKTLDEVVGKDIAKQILGGGEGVIEKEGLSVGGEGMKGFYDQMLVTDTNKLIKRNGGRVGNVDIAVQDPTEGSWGTFNAHGFDITPAMKHEAMGKGMQLFQPGKRASLAFADDGTAIMRGFKKPDVSSLLHESGHLFLATLPTKELDLIGRFYKVDPQLLATRTDSAITAMSPVQKRAWRAAHEKWAKDFEKYLSNGKAPTPELQSVFDKVRQWMLDIYKSIIGTPLEKDISPQIQGAMDRMLGGVDHGEGLATASGKMTRSTIRDEVKLLAGEYLQMNEATEAMRLARSLDLDLNDYGVGGTAALPDAADVVQTTFYHPDAPSEPVSVLRNKKFMSAVPAEWKDTIDGDRTLLQRVLVSSDPKRSRGSEEMLYLDAESILEAVGSDERKLLAAIKMGKSQNPRLAFYAEIYDAWPMGGRYGRKARVTNMSMVPAEALPIDTQFTINGRSAFVTVNEDGEKVVTLSGLDLFDTRASDLGSIPVDTGSTRAITPEEMNEIRALHGQTGYAGDAGEDIPLDPDSSLYQDDVQGQDALFKSSSGTSMVGRIGSGETQGGLFGSPKPVPAEAPAQAPTTDPVRMLNESDAAYAERVRLHRKFQGATENTNTLFQDDVDPFLPDFPTPRGAEELRWTEREKELNAQLAEQTGRLKEMRKALHADLASFSADAAADNIENVNDLLRVGELLRETDAAIDQAAARMRTARMAKALDLDADDAAMRMEELGEEVYHLVANDPRAADLIADTAAAQMEAALARREALRSTLQAVANDDELEMAELAKALIGTDDEAVALAAFAPLGKYVGDKFAERKSAANIADRMESFWRRTFGVRRGTANQTMAQLSALNSTAAIAASNHAIARMRLKIADLGLNMQPDDAAQLLHAHAYRLRDPEGGNYFWWKIGPNGEDLGASDMLQVIKRAEAAGVYANPETVKRLNETAQSFIDEMDELGRQGQASGILGLQVPAYMPKASDEVAQEAMTKHTRAGSPTPNTKGGGAWTQRFQKARTTDQVRFLAEDTLGAPKRWKQFFVGEVYLADVPDEALTPESKAIKDAVVEYFAKAEADPKWALDNLPRATDPFELNALYADPNQDRLKRLTGGMPLDELFETDLATVYGQRLGQDARARAMAQFAQFAEAQSLDVAPDQLALNGSNPSATIRLTGGTVAQPLGKVKTALGGESHAIRIGKEVYRQLDNSAWSKTDNIVSQMYGDLPGLKMERKMFPAALADRMEQFVQLASPERMPEMLQAAERITGMWKQMTLGFSPSWVAFNVIGNLFNGVAGGVSVKDFADVRQMRDIMAVRMAQHTPEKLEKMVVTLRTGQEMTGKELLDLVTENRIVNNALSTEQMAQLVKNDPGILAAGERAMRFASGPGYKLNGIVEDVMKMTAFVSFLNQGNDVATAQAKTLRAMFDYSDFTKSEKQLFRTMFPFYSWMRSNLGYQIMLLGERPAYAALMPKLKVALEEAASGEATVPENQRPSWMKNQLAAQVGADPTGRFAVMLGNTLPSGDLFQALAPVVGVEGAMSFLHYFAGNINPLASVPLQLGTGTEFFSGRSIGPDDVTGDMSAFDLLKSQIRPVAEAGKLADAYERGGVGQTAARALLGGRVQAFDQPRLDSSVRRELRDEEGKIRAAIGRANRRGDTEGSQQARARLLALYEDALKRGLDDAVPAWAEAQLAELASSPQ